MEIESDEFYTTPRHTNELPLGTRIEVGRWATIDHPWLGRKGEVVGYKIDRGIFPTGWHFIKFDDDDIYIGPENPAGPDLPYVHRDYLQVIE